MTLDQLITEAVELFAPGDAPTRYYAAALPHALAFRRSLLAGAGRSRLRRTAYLNLGDDRTVNLPDDYTEYTMLGLQLPGWAGTRNLIYNAHLASVAAPTRAVPAWLTGEAPAEVPDFLVAPTADECATACYGTLDADTDGYCGYGAACHGATFRVDVPNGRILCDTRVPGGAVLVLEYYAFGAPDGEDIPFDALAQDWGSQYLLWKLHLTKQNLGMAREYERLCREAETTYRNRTRHFSLDGAMQVKHDAAGQRWK